MRLRHFPIFTALFLFSATAAANDTAADAENVADEARLVNAALAESARLRDLATELLGTADGTTGDATRKADTPAATKSLSRLTKLRMRLASAERERVRDSYREQQLKLITARQPVSESPAAASSTVVAAEAD